MNKVVLLALTLSSVPAVWAAVLPIDLHVRAGGVHVLAQGKPVGVAAQTSPATRGEWTADTYQTWRDADGEQRVQFNLHTGGGDSRWGFGVRLRDLAGFPQAAVSGVAADVQFSWTREAGVFRFTGSFDNGRGRGSYAFEPSQSYLTNMASAGYRNLPADDVVRLAVIDVTTAHVRGLTQAGYPNLPLDDIIKTRIHRVTPEFIRELASLGYRNIALEDLVKMAIHKATPENIRALQAAGIRGLSVEELVRFRIHKVTPDFIAELKALGFNGMSADELVRFRIHKVTPEYIRSMREVGFTSASEDQLVKMRIHKVDALFVRHAREDGLTVQTPADAVDLAIHGPRRRRR